MTNVSSTIANPSSEPLGIACATAEMFDPTECAGLACAAPFQVDPDDLPETYQNKPIRVSLDHPTPKKRHQLHRLAALQTA